MEFELLELTLEVLCNLTQLPSQETHITVKLKFCFLNMPGALLLKALSTLTLELKCASQYQSALGTQQPQKSQWREHYISHVCGSTRVTSTLVSTSALHSATGSAGRRPSATGSVGHRPTLYASSCPGNTSHGHDRRAGGPAWQGKYTWGLYLLTSLLTSANIFGRAKQRTCPSPASRAVKLHNKGCGHSEGREWGQNLSLAQCLLSSSRHRSFLEGLCILSAYPELLECDSTTASEWVSCKCVLRVGAEHIQVQEEECSFWQPWPLPWLPTHHVSLISHSGYQLVWCLKMNHLLFWEQGGWCSDVRSVVFLLHWNVSFCGCFRHTPSPPLLPVPIPRIHSAQISPRSFTYKWIRSCHPQHICSNGFSCP